MSLVRRMGPAVRPLVASLALGLAVLGPMDARGQAAPAATSLDSTAAGVQAPAPQAAVSQAPLGSGLPRQAPPPRTLRAFWPVFALLGLGWIGMIAYLLRAGAVFGRIVEGVRRLGPDRAAE